MLDFAELLTILLEKWYNRNIYIAVQKKEEKFLGTEPAF